jgi:hypothetical protein
MKLDFLDGGKRIFEENTGIKTADQQNQYAEGEEIS